MHLEKKVIKMLSSFAKTILTFSLLSGTISTYGSENLTTLEAANDHFLKYLQEVFTTLQTEIATESTITDSNADKLADFKYLDYESEFNDSLGQYGETVSTVSNERAVKSATHFRQTRSPFFLPPDLPVLDVAIEEIGNDVCRRHAKMVLQAITGRENWAMRMFDSSAKFPEGVMFGSSYQLGNYDECLAVRLPKTENETASAKYCLADVMPNIPGESFKSRDSSNITIHWALCVPSSCPPKDVERFLGRIISYIVGANEAVTVHIPTKRCHVNTAEPFSSLEIIYLCVIICFLILTIGATVYHFLSRNGKDKTKTIFTTAEQILLSFSVIQNIGKLFKVNSSEVNLQSISGIKFISMVFIIAGHALSLLVSGPVMNDGFYRKEMRYMQNAIFTNNPLLVDTFLLISGFLMCYLLLIELEKRKGKINFLFLYIFRYIRLTPSYLIILGFYCTWFVRMNSGPLWDSRIYLEKERCDRSWWANLLYINNYVSTDNLCMFQSWYLAVDTQLFILAPFVIYPLWRWPQMGKILLTGLTIASVIIPFVITFMNKLDPTLMMYAEEINDLGVNSYFINAYIKTHMRACSYFIGLIFGYAVQQVKFKKFSLSIMSVTIGWALSAILGLISMFSVTIFYQPFYEYDVFLAALYSSLHRVAWSLSIGWVVFACTTNNGGYVDKLLSYKLFTPLSRITYCIYLINGVIELHSYASIKTSRHLSVYELMCEVCAHTLINLAAAFVLCLMFESPIHGLEKILLHKKPDREARNVQKDEPL